MNMIKSNRCGHSNQIQHCISDIFNKWLAIDNSFKSYEEGLKKVVEVLYKVGESTIADGSKGKKC